MGRRGSAIGFGFALLLGAVALLAWNEARAVRTERALAEGVRRVVEVDAARAAQVADGTLIHLVGDAVATAPLRDPATGVTRDDALRLRRSAETLQWRRVQVGDEHDSRYDYRQVWSATRIDTDGHPEAYRNPAALPLASATLSSPDARLGALALTTQVVEALTSFEPLVLSPADLAAVAAALGVVRVVRDDASGPTGPSESGPAAYLPYGGGTPEAPQVGDVRVRYEVVPAGRVSVVARKSGDRLEPFPTRSGVALALARSGVHGADALFAEAVARSGALTLGLRLLGFVGAAIAFRLLFSPLAALFAWIPIVGSLGRFGVHAVAGLLAVVVTLVTVGLAWLAVRPVLGVGLLLAAVGGVVLLARRPRAARAVAVAAPRT